MYMWDQQGGHMGQTGRKQLLGSTSEKWSFSVILLFTIPSCGSLL